VKRLAVLGSTGVIGRLCLEIAAAFPERFEVVGLAAGQNGPLLAEQMARFKPRLAPWPIRPRPPGWAAEPPGS
jgi:1-deoxy-D-xylulose-5-phosphate reductoisomerase